MNRDVLGPIYGERRVTDLLVEICQQNGWRWWRQRVHPERDNLLIVIDGEPSPGAGGELLLWDVHQDTVPIEGMSIEAFGGDVREGRVYGRGACDVKGTMSAMLSALSRRSESRPPLSSRGSDAYPTIVLACTVNEECGYTGAQALAGWLQTGLAQTADDFLVRLPDAAIVAEPTGLDVVVAHQGQVRWRCHTLGRAAHTSRPDTGVNAIYAMAQIIQSIERFHHKLTTSAPEHPLCGRPSICVSTIHGGVGINTVPELATIEIDRRLAPGERPDAAYEALTRYIAANADIGRCQAVHDPPFMQSVGLRDDRNRQLAERLAVATHSHGRPSRLVGVPFGTDAAAIAATGIPTVVFGPGSIDQAHTAQEFISIDELQLAADIFYQVACQGLLG